MVNRLIKSALTAWIAANIAGANPASAANAAGSPAAATATAQPAQKVAKAPKAPKQAASTAAPVPAPAPTVPTVPTVPAAPTAATQPVQSPGSAQSPGSSAIPDVDDTQAKEFASRWGVDIRKLIHQAVQNSDPNFIAKQKAKVFGQDQAKPQTQAQTQPAESAPSGNESSGEGGQSGQSGQSGDGKWITIGGHPGPEGKHQGGTPVQVDGEGNILKGPDAIEGKDIDDLKNKTPESPAQPEQPSAPEAVEPAPEPAPEAVAEPEKLTPLQIRLQKAAARKAQKEQEQAEAEVDFRPDELESPDGSSPDDSEASAEVADPGPKPKHRQFSGDFVAFDKALSDWKQKSTEFKRSQTKQRKAEEGRTSAKQVIENAARDIEMDPADLQEAVDYEIKSQKEFHVRKEAAKKELRRRLNLNARQISQMEDSYLDNDSVAGIDQLTDWAAEYPDMLEHNEEVGAAAWRLLKEGTQKLPSASDPEFVQKVAEDLNNRRTEHSIGKSGAYQSGSSDEYEENHLEPRESLESVPFSRTAVRMAVNRYVRTALQSQNSV
jgi:hypothetical protein